MNQPLEFEPHSIEAEQGVLGALLINNDCFDVVSEVVEPEHFYEPIHGQIYEIAAKLIAEGKRATPVTLKTFLPADIIILGMPLPKYLARLCAEATTVINAVDYAKMIRELWQLRRVIATARELQATAMRANVEGASVEAILDEADTELTAIRYGKEISGVQWIGQAADQSIAATANAYKLEAKVGFDFGITSIDEIVGPMMAGDLVTLLAPSGHGKTALATQLICRAAESSLDANRGKAGFLVSGEMRSLEIARRVMATHTGISTRSQKLGEVNEGEYSTLTDMAKSLHNLPVAIDDLTGQTMSRIARKCRAMKKRHNIGIVVVDHVKLIAPENPRWSKVDTIENAAEKLKGLAKELDVVMIVLAQPTREGQKSDRTWRLYEQSIYGGDTLKQYSDVLLSLANPHKWLRQHEPDPQEQKKYDAWVRQCAEWEGMAEIGALKLREAEDGIWRKIQFEGRRLLFSECAA